MIDLEEMMDVSDETIRAAIRREKKMEFLPYRDKKMSKTRLSLTQKALSMAKNGDRTMLIFCLKNVVGWSDNPVLMEYDQNELEFEIK